MARPDWSYLVHIFSLGMGGCFVITPLKPYLIVSLPVGHMSANNIHVAYFSQQTLIKYIKDTLIFSIFAVGVIYIPDPLITILAKWFCSTSLCGKSIPLLLCWYHIWSKKETLVVENYWNLGVCYSSITELKLTNKTKFFPPIFAY